MPKLHKEDEDISNVSSNQIYEISKRLMQQCGRGPTAVTQKEQFAKIEKEWQAIPSGLKTILLTQKDSCLPGVIFETAAACNATSFMQDCWEHATTTKSKYELLKGYFYGAVDKAVANGHVNVLETLWCYAKIIGVQQELAEQSFNSAILRAAQNGRTDAVHKLFECATTYGLQAAMLSTCQHFIDGSKTRYAPLWQAIDKGHKETALAILHLCHVAIKDFNLEDAFANIAPLSFWGIYRLQNVNKASITILSHSYSDTNLDGQNRDTLLPSTHTNDTGEMIGQLTDLTI